MEIIAAADFRRGAGFQSDEELSHSADEGVREPAFGPNRMVKTGIALAGVAQSGRRGVWILAPTDRIPAAECSLRVGRCWQAAHHRREIGCLGAFGFRESLGIASLVLTHGFYRLEIIL